jgi:hypothetical protein
MSNSVASSQFNGGKFREIEQCRRTVAIHLQFSPEGAQAGADTYAVSHANKLTIATEKNGNTELRTARDKVCPYRKCRTSRLTAIAEPKGRYSSRGTSYRCPGGVGIKRIDWTRQIAPLEPLQDW